MYIRYNNYDFRYSCYACLYKYENDPPFLKLFPPYLNFECPGYYEGAILIAPTVIVDCQNP